MTEINNFTNTSLNEPAAQDPNATNKRESTKSEVTVAKSVAGIQVTQNDYDDQSAKTSSDHDPDGYQFNPVAAAKEYEPISPNYFLRKREYVDTNQTFAIEKTKEQINAKVERSLEAIEKELLTIKDRRGRPLLLRILERKDPEKLL